MNDVQRHVDKERLLLVEQGFVEQRGIDDVHLRITYRDGRAPRTGFVTPGRARYLLTRYPSDKFDSNPDLPAKVEECPIT